MGKSHETIDNKVQEYTGLDPIENLVFQGGGVKGVAYIGFLEEAKRRGALKNVKRVGGSSAGGIISLMVGLGLETDEIKDEMKNVDFKDFQDVGDEFWPLLPTPDNMVSPVSAEGLFRIALSKKHGISKGEAFHNWAKQMIAKRLGNPNATFKDLREAIKVDPSLKDLMFTGCDISGRGDAMQYFNVDTTPDVKIADAVRATMSFPGAFEPFEIEVNGIKRVFIDGGAVNNFPAEFYDDEKFLPPGKHLGADGVNKSTLGVRVDTIDGVSRYKWNLPGQPRDLESVAGFVRGAGRAALAPAISGQHKLREKYGMTTIQIPDQKIDTLHFGLTIAEKNCLIESGTKATSEWFDLYRSAGVVKDISLYDSLNELYRNKTEKENRKAVLKLQREYKFLGDQQGRVGKRAVERRTIQRENIERMRQILQELRIIREITPNAFKKETKEEMAVKKATQLLRTKSKIASLNERRLLELQKAYSEGIEIFRSIYDGLNNQNNALDRLMEDEVTNKLLTSALQNIGMVQARRIELSQRIDEQELMGEGGSELAKKEIESMLTTESNNILRVLEMELSRPELHYRYGDNDRELIRNIVKYELDRIKKEDDPRNLQDVKNYFLQKKNNAFQNLTDFLEGKQQCDRNIADCIQKRRSLEFKRHFVGDNFSKMITLASDFDKFIKEQDTFLVRAYEVTTKVLQTTMKYLSFGILPLFGWAVSKLSNAIGLTKKLEEMGITENLFVPNKVLYQREAKKLRKNIQDIVNDWKEDEPRRSFQAYEQNLEKTRYAVEERGLKWFSKSNQRKLLRLIEKGDTHLSRVRPAPRPSPYTPSKK